MRKNSKRFQARAGASISNKDALVLGSEFDRIVSEGVELTPKAVLARAEDEGNPLHRYFDWDDASAARKQRIAHARYLIGAVVELHIEIQQPVRSYQSITIEPQENGHLAFKRRDMLSDDEEGQIAVALLRRMLPIVREAEALGLQANRQWAVIIKTVYAMRAAAERKTA